MDNTGTSAVGRRKEAVARVRLNPGNGQMLVNGKTFAEYFPGTVKQKLYSRPLEVTETVNKYAISVVVSGGGQVSQLGAIIHALSRAIAKDKPALRGVLKKEGFLTRNAKVKERRKYGHAQKARAKKQSPKR